ncbi:MAG: PSD1 and planctomycete cytochrome C domain-containing protein [Verrucomicrobiota bacterium]
MNGPFAGRLGFVAAALSGMLAAWGAAAPAPALDPAKVEFFETRIRPLLADRCEKCHSAAAGKSKGDLTLDTRAGWEKGGQNGPALVPGKPDESLLLKAIGYTDPDLRMPPKKEGGPLKEDEVAAVRRWISEGAVDPRTGTKRALTGMSPEAKAHWAFQPVRKPALPEVRDTAWGRNEVDRFILAKLEAAGMTPNPPATREALLRRVTYDLTGLPPTLEEVNEFVADKSPGAYEKVVDRLLASPQYGERWGRHWLDTARYSDTTGMTGDGGGRRYQDYRYEYAWTYRDYVIQSFNADKPWNEFLTEQLAADLLPGVKADDPRLAALGFLTVGKRFESGDDLIDERIDATSKAMLGLTVSCARCHDHKFDPIPTADYYSWHGIFASITEPYDPPELAGTADPELRENFQRRLAALEAKNRTIFEGFFQRTIPEFQRHAEGYLMVAAQKSRSPERQAMAKSYQLYPEDPEILRALRLVPEHPVLGPFAKLSRIPTNEFAARAPDVLLKALADPKAPVNRLVAEALLGLKPSRLEDVAQVYGRLFAKVGTNTTLLLQRRSKADGPQDLDDPAMTELVQTPYQVPTYAEIATSEAQEAYLAPKPGRRSGQGPPPFEGKTQNTFQFPAINQLRLTHPGAPGRAMVVEDKPKPVDSYVHIRGDRAKRGPVVPRRTLEILGGADRKPFKQGSGRLELARSITDPRNPLTARVLVNRVWMYHFGRGLVPTPDDLGTMSEAPSHPELLDYLAAEFVEKGWALKPLHKRILMSAAYQQSSETRPDYQAKDPENRLVWRANLRRLDFEAIRDSLVLLTGKMDPTLGGKPVNLTDEPYSYRRSVYGYVDRLRMSDLLSQFDFSDPEMVNTRRISTIVPQQALFFLNSPMTVDVARHLMSRSEVEEATDDDARVTAIYRILFQRAPESRELQWARDYLERTHTLLYGSQHAKGPRATKSVYKPNKLVKDKFAAVQNAGVTVQRGALNPWESYVQALLCSNEFVYVN